MQTAEKMSSFTQIFNTSEFLLKLDSSSYSAVCNKTKLSAGGAAPVEGSKTAPSPASGTSLDTTVLKFSEVRS